MTTKMTLKTTRKFTTTLLILGLGTALSTVAFAGPRKHVRMQHLTQADTNQDGEVSLAEFTNQRETHFSMMDANGDGTITKEERKLGRQAMRAQKADEHFAKVDANNDGFISRAEFDTARADRSEGRHKMRKRKMKKHQKKMAKNKKGHAKRMHQKADANGDGNIDRAEYDAATQSMFSKIDTNKDGVLTKADRKRHKDTSAR